MDDADLFFINFILLFFQSKFHGTFEPHQPPPP